MNLRKAVFAGSWYPEGAAACKQEIEQFMARGAPKPRQPSSWMGGIVPHAGWYYSGQIACNVIQWLQDASPPDLVVLFGMHLHAGSPNYLMPTGAWETPFGSLPVDEELAGYLMQRFDFTKETTQRFAQDNTIELQLPFVKYLLDPMRILAVGVPPNPDALAIGTAVADWARQKGRRLKIIGSTDLTHYGRNYGFSPKGSGAEAVQWARAENDRRIDKWRKACGTRTPVVRVRPPPRLQRFGKWGRPNPGRWSMVQATIKAPATVLSVMSGWSAVEKFGILTEI